jgi:predicted nucleic acid-binding protein
MLYLDTSVIIALLVPETHSDRADAFIGKQQKGTLFVSDWTGTEVSSALAVRVRTGSITLDRRTAALAIWRSMRDNSFLRLATVADHFDEAARLCDSPSLGLRAADALHVAIAIGANAHLVTLDTRMAEAALQLGIPVEPL